MLNKIKRSFYNYHLTKEEVRDAFNNLIDYSFKYKQFAEWQNSAKLFISKYLYDKGKSKYTQKEFLELKNELRLEAMKSKNIGDDKIIKDMPQSLFSQFVAEHLSTPENFLLSNLEANKLDKNKKNKINKTLTKFFTSFGIDEHKIPLMKNILTNIPGVYGLGTEVISSIHDIIHEKYNNESLKKKVMHDVMQNIKNKNAQDLSLYLEVLNNNKLKENNFQPVESLYDQAMLKSRTNKNNLFERKNLCKNGGESEGLSKKLLKSAVNTAVSAGVQAVLPVSLAVPLAIATEEIIESYTNTKYKVRNINPLSRIDKDLQNLTQSLKPNKNVELLVQRREHEENNNVRNIGRTV